MENKTQKRNMWQAPWGYPEGAALIVGILLIGVALQLSLGHFDFYFLAHPVNYLILASFVLLSVALGVFAKKNSVVLWLSGSAVATLACVALTVLTVVMGLSTQQSITAHSTQFLGIDAMTRTWYFVLIYGFTLLSLGVLICRKLSSKLTRRSVPFMFNHLGLWLLLAASGLGYADMERYIMHVMERDTEWRVYSADGEVRELPIAITLNDFDMDVYAPKIAVIDKNTGEVLPLAKPEYFQLDTLEPRGTLAGWKVELKEYLHNAVRSSDSTYQAAFMPGATPAALVTLSKGSTEVSGWVCGGNQSQLFMTLALDEQFSVVMTTPEPRVFTSDIEVYTEDNKTAKTVLKVNSPLRIGSWTIYQYGYDNKMGRLSAYSSFELVYDPWLKAVYFGITMIMLGALTMIWNGKK